MDIRKCCGTPAKPATPHAAGCKNETQRQALQAARKRAKLRPPRDPDTEPDWSGRCESCGQSPIVPATGMCGPCTFGEAETIGGNW